MARIRTIKPEFWRDEDLCALPEATHMLAAALLNYSDDFGYFNANPKLIEGEIYPLRRPTVKIPESLRSLQTIGYIELGTTPDGKNWGRVVHFTKHQRVSHPTESKISCLSITWEHSGNAPENIVSPPETFVPERKGTGKGKEQGREAPRASRFGEFWDACPKKVGKGKAQNLFDKASRTVNPDLLIAGIKRFAADEAGKDPTYTAHPATWLSQRRWEDEGAGAVASAEVISIRSAFTSPEELEGQRKAMERIYGQSKN